MQREIIGLLQMDPPAGRRTAREFASSDTPELRLIGLWALGFVVDPGDVELLAAAATDADPKVRSRAIDSVPDPAGNDQAFQVLVRALGDLDEQVRASAVSRLGYTGRADAVAPPTSLVADWAPRVRSMVAYALGRLRSAEATPALLRLLRDSERQVRERAADALGSVGGPDAIDALLALAADQEPQLRIQAAKALGKVVDADSRVRTHITMLARDGEAAVRAVTLSGLASADSTASIWAPLVVELANDADPVVRQRVAVVARRLAPDAAVDILQRYTGDRDPTLRRLATAELARLTNTAAG